jgi:hypothetical protein
VFADAKMWVGFCAVLVPPSPKFQDQEVGVPVEVSVNETVCPFTGAAGVNVNPALTVPAWITATVRPAVLEFVPLPAVSATVNAPAAAKIWVGFWSALVAPSPKFQDQEVGFPVEVSVNETVCPVTGAAGVNANPALTVPACVTVTVRLVEPDPAVLLAFRVTVNVPAAA